MRKENPVIYNLRVTTIQVIENLYCSGRFNTYKAACEYFFNIAKKKNQQTGFDLADFNRFYNNYRQQKHLFFNKT